MSTTNLPFPSNFLIISVHPLGISIYPTAEIKRSCDILKLCLFYNPESIHQQILLELILKHILNLTVMLPQSKHHRLLCRPQPSTAVLSPCGVWSLVVTSPSPKGYFLNVKEVMSLP